ncbi:unnamed protein product (mitochondrion) [Plasmodiophora brassicae]|uniref:Uncharacterized protein n=1 Tax=Plasmodiophora brassicae TaxID=37360 RepID=A0A3P3YG30_PLABS|nr:unnamed protein product [Plasmodiophora brassicae]
MELDGLASYNLFAYIDAFPLDAPAAPPPDERHGGDGDAADPIWDAFDTCDSASRLLRVDPWLLDDDDDQAADSARLLKTSMFPYVTPAVGNYKRPRLETFKPVTAADSMGARRINPAAISSDSQAPIGCTLPSPSRPLQRLSTPNLFLVQMQDADWDAFRTVVVGYGDDASRVRDAFDMYLRQWRTNRLGPFVVYARERWAPDGQHLAGFLKLSLSNGSERCQSLQIRFALLPQYCNQRRVIYEALQAVLVWLLDDRRLFDQHRQVYVPYEISASRQNAIAMMANGHDGAVLISDVQEGAQQQMVLTEADGIRDVVARIEAHLASGDLIPDVINADIWTSRSENGLFEMCVKWEVPLLKVDDDGSIHLFMSTYHDTPVETTLLTALPVDATYKMRLDLCAVEATGAAADSPDNCCRIKAKDVTLGQATIVFSGVRKAKVGDKTRVYVIRSQLVRHDKRAVVIDTCQSRACQLTSSRRVYRAADDRIQPPDVLSPVSDASWESRSSLLAAFTQACVVHWKAGFPLWLFTQEKVAMEVRPFGVPGEAAMRVQLVDVQSNLPVHLVAVNHTVKSSTETLVAYGNDDGAWVVDLRVNSKKEVQNRMSYLHVSFHRVTDRHVHPEPDAEFNSTFVINVGTTYANLRRRPA